MSEFSQHYDQTIRALEAKLSDLIDSGSDMDYDRAGDVLTIEFSDGERYVVTPNAPVQQLWLSANYSGQRYNWSDESEQWLNDKSATPFTDQLAELLSAKLGEPIEL